MPKCDVIIPIHNAIQWVRLCLQELLAHTDDEVLGDVVLVNDNSTPESRAQLEALVREMPRAKLLHNTGTSGFGGACNFGVRNTSSPYFLLLNTDCLVTRGTVRKLVSACEADATIGLTCPLSNNSPVLTLPLRAGRTFWEMNTLLERAFSNATQDERVLDACTVVGNCLLVSRKCWDDVGEFDPSWGRGYGEETDLQMRAMEKGYRGTVCVDTYVYHHGGASFRYDPEAIELQKTNLQKFFAEWGPEYRDFASRCAARDPVDIASRALDALGDVPFVCDVLFVLPGISQEIGGIHAAVDACNHLCRNGIEARCVVLNSKLDAVPPTYHEPLFFGLLSFEHESQWLACYAMRPRIVVATLFSTVLPAMLYARKRDARLVKFVQGYEFFFDNGRVRQEVLAAFDAVDDIWTTSSWLEAQTQRHKPTARITRAPLLVDPLVFFPKLAARASDAPLRVCAVVRSAPDKGQWVLLEALDLLGEVEGIELTFVAPEQYTLPPIWADREGTRVVKLPIDRVRMGEVLRGADVLIDASFHEGWGLLPHEAISSGVVPIVSDSGGIRDFVRHEESGLVIEAVNRPERYVEAVRRLNEDRALLGRLREGALRYARTLYEQATAKGIVTMARSLLEEKAPSATAFEHHTFVEGDHVNGVEIVTDAVRLPAKGCFVPSRSATFAFSDDLPAGSAIDVTLVSAGKALAELHTLKTGSHLPPPRPMEHKTSTADVVKDKALGVIAKKNPKAAKGLRAIGRRLNGKRVKTVQAHLSHALHGISASVRARTSWTAPSNPAATRLTVPHGGNWGLSVHSIGGAYVHHTLASAEGRPTGADAVACPTGAVTLNGYVMLATGRDPILHLEPFAWSERSLYVLHADVFTSTDTMFQVFYQVEGESTFTEQRSAVRPLLAGENSVIVVLANPRIAGPLRIDPGDRRAVIGIRSLSVVRIPRTAR